MCWANPTVQGGGKRRAEDIGWRILRDSNYYSGMKRKLFKTHNDRWERASQRYPNFVDRRGIVFHRDIIWKANLSWADGLIHNVTSKTLYL
jgi:hypothetical protein